MKCVYICDGVRDGDGIYRNKGYESKKESRLCAKRIKQTKTICKRSHQTKVKSMRWILRKTTIPRHRRLWVYGLRRLGWQLWDVRTEVGASNYLCVIITDERGFLRCPHCKRDSTSQGISATGTGNTVKENPLYKQIVNYVFVYILRVVFV